jgi:hypothetical protein
MSELIEHIFLLRRRYPFLSGGHMGHRALLDADGDAHGFADTTKGNSARTKRG